MISVKLSKRQIANRLKDERNEKLQVAYAALLDDFTLVSKLLPAAMVEDLPDARRIFASDLYRWPLFEEFRKTDEFLAFSNKGTDGEIKPS